MTFQEYVKLTKINSAYMSNPIIERYSRIIGDKNLIEEGAISFLKKALKSSILIPAVVIGSQFVNLQKAAGQDSKIEIVKDSNETVARIIFSEAGPTVSTQERLLVASVIKNRIGHKGFKSGKLKSMEDVVKDPGQFSSLNDNKNSNWRRSANLSTFTTKEKEAWNQAVLLSRGQFNAIPDVIYFHDKSINKPSIWDNPYWHTELVAETPKFKFYKVLPGPAQVVKKKKITEDERFKKFDKRINEQVEAIIKQEFPEVTSLDEIKEEES